MAAGPRVFPGARAAPAEGIGHTVGGPNHEGGRHEACRRRHCRRLQSAVGRPVCHPPAGGRGAGGVPAGAAAHPHRHLFHRAHPPAPHPAPAGDAAGDGGKADQPGGQRHLRRPGPCGVHRHPGGYGQFDRGGGRHLRRGRGGGVLDVGDRPHRIIHRLY